MGTCSFQIRNETFFCKVKASGNPRFRRGTKRSTVSAKKSRDCAETYIWYIAQGIPLIDTDLPAIWQAGTAKKGHF
jgi:hypothetical protein